MLVRLGRVFGSGGPGGGVSISPPSVALHLSETAPSLGGQFTNKNIVAVGDSITNGFETTTPYPGLVAGHFGTTSVVKAHDGSGWVHDGGTGSIPANSSEVDAVVTVPPQTLILFAGTNDFAFDNADPTTIFNDMMTYRAGRVSAGFNASKIIIATMLPRGSFIESLRTSYNSLIVSNASTYGYAVARLDLDPNIGPLGSETNLTYYNSDQVHPNNAGHSIIAGIFEAVMS
jgi:lysophospholipase L1-like esterase